MANTIKCPSCGEEIEISEALSQTIKSDLEKELSEKLSKKLKEESSLELKQLQEELKLKNAKLDESRDAELKLRQEKLLLEDEKRSFELEKQRQIDEERNKIRQQTLLEASDSHRLKDLEKDKMINDLKQSLEDAQRKASQRSQQLQGEVQELDIEESLRSTFPFDDIAGIGKGVRGADISQTVRTKLGNKCGVILWESKRTQAWTDSWVSKLKDDLRASKADIPVIVTPNLPKEMKVSFGNFQGVWVCSPQLVIPVAEIMRGWLNEVAREKFVSQNRTDKAEMLYSYIVSNEFLQQIESIAETYNEMQEQISKEKAAFERIWKARESQIQRLMKGTTGIAGSVQGIVGQSLPNIKGLDLLEESIS